MSNPQVLLVLEEEYDMEWFDDLTTAAYQLKGVADVDALWLGVDNAGPNIDGPTGRRNEDVRTRMHLTKEHARDLIVVLQRFVETGSVRA